MERGDVYIVGAGTYGEVMLELAQILGFNVKGFFDEDESKINKNVMGKTVIGKFSDLDSTKIKGNKFIVAIGNNAARLNLMSKINKFGGQTPTLIHPTAVISPSAEIGYGVYIHANAYIWSNAKIGNYCIVSPNVVIAHHTSIGEACLISTLSGVGASIKVENLVFIGMGSTIVTGVTKIGSNTIIGAGAVLLNDAESNSIYVGIPAKKCRKNE